MYLKTINLLPAERDLGTGHPPFPSLVASLGVLLLCVVVGGTLGDEAPAPLANAEMPRAAGQPAYEVPVGDPVALSLARADGWVPWQHLFADLPDLFRDLGSLDRIEFRRDQGVLEITGTTSDVHLLSDLMLFLEQYSWLEDPVPLRVARDAQTGASAFTLHVGVVPYLTLEALP